MSFIENQLLTLYSRKSGQDIETSATATWQRWFRVIGWLAFIQNLFHSDSVFVNHIFCHIASTLILIVAALTTIALGGKSKAVFVILLSFSIMPARAYQLFQPVAFTHLYGYYLFISLFGLLKPLTINIYFI